MKIFIDDLFDTDRASWVPEGFVGVRNFTEFKELLDQALDSGEKIEAISFDNDLGNGEMEGWQIAKWLTETHPDIFETFPEFIIHSANPEGRRNIDGYLKIGINNYRELMEAKNRPDPWSEFKVN